MDDLERAREAFEGMPTTVTAGIFMAALMEAEAEGAISDDEWLDGLASIRDFLLP